MYPRFPPLAPDGHFECNLANPSNVSASPSNNVWNSESIAFPGSDASTRMCETFTAPSWLTAEEEDDAAAAKVLRAHDEDDVDEGLAVSLRAEYAHAVDKHKRIFGLFVCVGKKRCVRIELLKRKDECRYHLNYSLH